MKRAKESGAAAADGGMTDAAAAASGVVAARAAAGIAVAPVVAVDATSDADRARKAAAMIGEGIDGVGIVAETAGAGQIAISGIVLVKRCPQPVSLPSSNPQNRPLRA